MNKLVGGVAVVTLLVLVVMWPAGAEADDDMWPPSPAVGAKVGAGIYHSVPCGCVDRRLANVELSGQLHFGRLVALEADLQRGVVLTGGNFPSSGWSVGTRVGVMPAIDRWWDEISVRVGYKRWSTMGMRVDGAHGAYGAINWAPEIVSHVYLETDLIGSRVFRDMPHWSVGTRLGASVRF